MTKDWLVSFIAEKARISPQRAELAYNAFWEAILSELKTGHFSLPYAGGNIQLKEKGFSLPKDLPAPKEAKAKGKESKSASKKSTAKTGASKTANRTAKKPVSRNNKKSTAKKKK